MAVRSGWCCSRRWAPSASCSLIACVNVANPPADAIGVRARRKSPIRSRLARAAGHIIRQLLVESGLLAALGGGLGLAADVLRRRAGSMSRRKAPGRPSYLHFTLDATVLAFFAAILPHDRSPLRARAGAADVEDRHQRGHQRGGRGGISAAGARARWTNALVVGELAVTLVLWQARLHDPQLPRALPAGRRPETAHVLTMNLSLPDANAPDRRASRIVLSASRRTARRDR